MNYMIFCIGKIKDEFYRKEIERLTLNLKKCGISFRIMEFPDVKIPDNLKDKNKEVFLEKECKPITDRLSNRDYIIALCVEGKEIGTKRHAEYVKKAQENGYENVVYLIGGSLGLPVSIKEKAHLRLSLSKMTFPHQLMRVVLTEEISRISY